MKITRLCPNFATAGQLLPQDVQMIRAQGYRSILCVRPDHEALNQPNFDEIAEAAARAGLEARYFPVTVGQPSKADVEAFGRLLDGLEGPVLAYCRSGARAASLWSQATVTPPDPG